MVAYIHLFSYSYKDCISFVVTLIHLYSYFYFIFIIGHADTAQFEWCVNQQRDTYASYMGHFDMLNMIAIGENETKARVRFNMMEKMVQPCGPPPEKNED